MGIEPVHVQLRAPSEEREMLTVAKIENAKPGPKPRKLFDEKGLFLLISPTGSKGWRFKYQFGGKAKSISFGPYPEVPLKEAREKRDNARKLLRGDPPVDPSAKRKADKLALTKAQLNSFEAVARQWLTDKHRHEVEATTADVTERRLELHLFPAIGKRPIAEITAPDLLDVLEQIQRNGTMETAHRCRSIASRVWRYAILKRLVDYDVAAGLKGDALISVPTKHFAALTDPRKVGELMKAIDNYEGQPATRAALQVIALTFVRPGELRNATWGELDLDAAEWRIPGDRMKMGDEHFVPLSTQAVSILEELAKLTNRGPERYVFPSLRPRRPLSENTLNMALRNMGFAGDQHTAHGFRSTASTLLHEMGFPPEVVELQLAHQIPSAVARAYNRSARLAERKNMMQSWADYLDNLKTGKTNVVPLRGDEASA